MWDGGRGAVDVGEVGCVLEDRACVAGSEPIDEDDEELKSQRRV